MRGALFAIVLGACLLSCKGEPEKTRTTPSCIDEKLVASLFKEIRRKGAWDLDEPLLWAYYFEDREQEPLVALRSSLEQSGYSFVELMAPERPGDSYVLHMSRVEKHSAASLNARNRKLCSVAKKLKVGAYKGMDVGPVAGERR